MGTNYYVGGDGVSESTGLHVGKVSGRGGKVAFMWDMEPRVFIRDWARNHPQPNKCYVHTRDGPCPLCVVLEAIETADSEEFDSIGTGFC